MLANKMKMDSANHKQTDDVDVLKKKIKKTIVIQARERIVIEITLFGTYRC